MRRRLMPLLLLGLAGPAWCAPTPDQLALPAGVRIALNADRVPQTREMARGANGTVFGSMDAGKIYALADADGDGRAERVRVIAHGAQLPVGVAVKDGDLSVSAVSRILVLRDVGQHLGGPPAPVAVVDNLPAATHRGWQLIAFGPDGKLYVPLGAPCNVCDKGKAYAKLTRMNAEGRGREDVAYGIRNTVGLDWQPGTGTLWLTGNGRDLLGDDVSSDELNRVTRLRQPFGFPYCRDVIDPEYGGGTAGSDYVPPALKLGTHVAALGLRFYRGRQCPAHYRGAMFIAEHGSWNRTTQSGYRVMAARPDGAKVTSYEPLITGFERHGQAWGRPVDVQPLPDGSLLVSDGLTGR